MASKKQQQEGTPGTTGTTSISVPDPKVIQTIKQAAAKKGESMSKFILAAAENEAVRVLRGACPSCGRSMKGSKAAA